MDIKSRIIIGIVIFNIFLLSFLLVVFHFGITDLNMDMIVARYQVAQNHGDVKTHLSIEQPSLLSSEVVITAENQEGKVLSEVRTNFLIPLTIMTMILINGLMLIIFLFRKPIYRWIKITT